MMHKFQLFNQLSLYMKCTHCCVQITLFLFEINLTCVKRNLWHKYDFLCRKLLHYFERYENFYFFMIRIEYSIWELKNISINFNFFPCISFQCHSFGFW